jgi:serine protease Do
VSIPRYLVTVLGMFLLAGVPAWGDGFDRAITAATSRVVKLYGLGAGAQAGFGTGFLISADGRVLTVLSLLIDARRIRVVTADGTRLAATVVRRDVDRQLALLQLVPWNSTGLDAITEGGQRVASLADSSTPVVGPFPWFDMKSGSAMKPDGTLEFPTQVPSHCRELQPGDWLIAAGNAFKVAEGAEPVSIARGVFSVRTRLDARRRVRDFPYRGEVLVIDAITSNPGAPGSAVVDLTGRLVGMVGRDVISNLTHTHFNYAVPMEVLVAFVREVDESPAAGDELAKPSDSAESSTTSRDLGLRLARTGYRTILPFVERVRGGSPAARAGVQSDDLILSVNGKSVGDVHEYDDRIKSLAPDEPVDLVIRRGRQIITLRIEAEIK